MSDIRITNCHIHTFTAQHVPEHFPFRLVKVFRKAPWLIKLISGVAHFRGWANIAETLDRLYQFQQQGALVDQQSILDDVKRHYPKDTRFVILPMDMAEIGYGEVPTSLREQHDELYRMRADDQNLGDVIPFATVNPLADGSIKEARRALCELGFEGLKIYPRMGFAPDHPELLEKVYPIVSKKNLPVMTHCSRGGVQGRYLDDYFADRYTEPKAYIPVMRRFPDLRICLAHFGGQRDWRAYADGTAPSGDKNWQVQIRRMIGSGDYPNLWTDISYTLFHFEDYIPFLRLFLLGDDPSSERLRGRVLFGSDFYMTRQEKLSEKEVCFRLRNALGEEIFRQIAEENPQRWLKGPSVELDA